MLRANISEVEGHQAAASLMMEDRSTKTLQRNRGKKGKGFPREIIQRRDVVCDWEKGNQDLYNLPLIRRYRGIKKKKKKKKKKKSK